MRSEQALNGIWKGIVEDTTDPNNLGRMKIRVPEVHGTQANVPTQDIPWCGVCLPAHSFAIPVVGDGVWTMFEKGDIHFPVYMGTMKFLSLGITAKGALPSSPPLMYQAPGNSPPPPLPPDVSIINAQRQSAATVLGVDVNLIPFPTGYGLDSVGALQNITNTVTVTAINTSNSLVSAALAAAPADRAAAMTNLQAQLSATLINAQSSGAIPQLFPSSIGQATSQIQATLDQVNALIALPLSSLSSDQLAQFQAGLGTAQSTMTSIAQYGWINTIDTVLASTVAQLQSTVMNFETYFEMPGIQVPQIALGKQSPDPVVRVLIQSPSGHTVAANDDPGNEFMRIIDRVGQILDFDGAVSTMQNLNNKNQRTGDVLHGGAVPILTAVNQRARITLMDLMGQFLQLDANDPAGVSQAKVILQGINSQALIIDGTANANKITLQGSAGGFLIIDSTTGDLHVTLEDGNDNSVLMTPTGMIITDSNGNTITMSAAGIVLDSVGTMTLTATGVMAGGTSAVKHLVYLEDLETIFNTHTHPSDGAPPNTPPLTLANGTSIMTGE
jgi:hypothetical protein